VHCASYYVYGIVQYYFDFNKCNNTYNNYLDFNKCNNSLIVKIFINVTIQ